MKNALILHGTDNNSQNNWFGWLGHELRQLGYTTSVPDLPGAHEPDIDRYYEYITRDIKFNINEETIMIGHSSGAVAILGILDRLPDDQKIRSAYLVGSFMDDLGEAQLRRLFIHPLNLEHIKSRCSHFVYFHSDDDPYCPLDHAKYLQTHTGGELIIMPGQKHFSISTAGEQYRTFPRLLEAIKSGS